MLSRANDFHRVLHKEEAARLLAKGRQTNYHWLNTENRKLLLTAINNNKTTVELLGLTWKVFEISYRKPLIVYIKPYGRKAPFTPTAEFELDRLRASVK